jgi:ParB family chromosome partitioning protein
MPNRKAPLAIPSLGRGQAAHPAGAPVTREGERVLPGAMSVPIEQVVPDPNQPRRDMGDESLAALADSLTTYGVLQPLLVREAGLLDDGRTRYMIVAGGRRYAAALLAGLTRLPVVVRDTEGATLRMTQLVENIQRQDLAPLEEARAFQELMDAEGINAEELATRLRISGQRVRERLHVLADQVLADAVERGQITPTIARDVLRLPDEGRRDVRQRIEDGEAVTRTDVKRTRERVEATGARDPRAKGGGRAGRATHHDTAGDAATLQRAQMDQARLDNAPSPVVTASPVVSSSTDQVGLDPALDSAFEMLDLGALDRVLRYGIAREWTCEELWQAIQERRV